MSCSGPAVPDWGFVGLMKTDGGEGGDPAALAELGMFRAVDADQILSRDCCGEPFWLEELGTLTEVLLVFFCRRMG